MALSYKVLLAGVTIMLLSLFIVFKLKYVEHFTEPKTWNRDTDYVIVSSHFNEDLGWLKRSPYPVVVCSKLHSDAALPIDQKCSSPINKGKEVTAYLKFIIEYYDDLPKNVAFIHGHEKAWHQHLDIFDAIKCADARKYGFVSLNNCFSLS